MLRAEQKRIIMTEGDFGISLPIKITGGTVSSDDSIRFSLKNNVNEDVITPKTFTNLKDNTFYLSFTKEDSDSMKAGCYKYHIDWFKEDVFMNNIVKDERFTVEER